MADSTPVRTSPAVLRLHPDDDVAVALQDLSPGSAAPLGGGAIVRDVVPRGHKIALRDLAAGAVLRKYGAPIGRANRAIRAGEWVHEHNLASGLDGLLVDGMEPATARPLQAAAAAATRRTFDGYRRADGRVGTRNEIWIIPTVGCVARTAERLAREASLRWAGRLDGVHAFGHPLGCSQLGGDLDATRRLLAALAQHPNAGGVLLLGLGCESNQLARLLEELPAGARHRIRALEAQREVDEIDAGTRALDELAEAASAARRERCGLDALRLGLKCGGSDAFSGITANPLLGRVADRVAAEGGAVLLSEIPEMFGAEALLAARARDAAVAAGFREIVNDFRRHFIDHGESLDGNPSPGNRRGGITTLEEKSLGAVQKGGRVPLTHVLRYGDTSTAAGLGVVEAPGNDAVSTTAMAAAGANLLLFTTGRGTPLGCPVPTLKIASNSALATAKPRWIDFDAGGVLEGDSIEAASERLLELVVATASGAAAANERNDERSIAIWKRGVTL